MNTLYAIKVYDNRYVSCCDGKYFETVDYPCYSFDRHQAITAAMIIMPKRYIYRCDIIDPNGNIVHHYDLIKKQHNEQKKIFNGIQNIFFEK